jgi:hypothetical protein
MTFEVNPSKTYYLITYTTVAGSVNFSNKVVLEGTNETASEVIDRYFSQYWDNTITDVKCRRYVHDVACDEEFIEINSVEVISDTDAYVLRKYL